MEMNGTNVIARPVETVAAYVFNVDNDVNWRYGVSGSRLSSGAALEVGAVGHTAAGDQEVDWRIISFTPGESVDWEFLNGPFKGRGGYRLVPVAVELTSHWWLTLNPPVFTSFSDRCFAEWASEEIRLTLTGCGISWNRRRPKADQIQMSLEAPIHVLLAAN